MFHFRPESLTSDCMVTDDEIGSLEYQAGYREGNRQYELGKTSARAFKDEDDNPDFIEGYYDGYHSAGDCEMGDLVLKVC